MSALKKQLISAIDEILSSSRNSLQTITGEKAWEDALVGFSSGSDPLYRQIKADIGPFYWTPAEIFSLTYPEIRCEPEALSVVSWVLPQTAATRADQRRQKKYPAERWSRSRNFGEETNINIARHLVDTLGHNGYPAVAPVLSSAWGWQTSDRCGFASNWSERHAAYISGLGTFGLCDGLITAKGKAMRCGSLVVKACIPPTPRKYRHHHEYCLFYANGKCKKCISRCPAGAITEQGHNKEACKKFLFEIAAVYAKNHFGFSSYGCGFCQTAVPCEAGIPRSLP
jgi:epoxyqueuosine reductase QueG